MWGGKGGLLSLLCTCESLGRREERGEVNGTIWGEGSGASTRGGVGVRAGAETRVSKLISRQRDVRIISGTRKTKVSASRNLKLSIYYYIIAKAGIQKKFN